MENKQTAVEWLVKELFDFANQDVLIQEKLIEQAKQMEKEQLNIARLDGISLANGGYSKKQYINNIKSNTMNIKVKAALTVLAGLGLLTALAVGILSIPNAWWTLYGITIIECAIMVVGIYLMYKAAVEYYTWKDELKKRNF